jgi:hypothetical protein
LFPECPDDSCSDSDSALFPGIEWVEGEEKDAFMEVNLLLLTKLQPMSHRGLVRSLAFERDLQLLDTPPKFDSNMSLATPSLLTEAEQSQIFGFFESAIAQKHFK